MNIHLIGISHKTAPIEIRERFFLKETERELLLGELKSHPAVVEAIVLSTCNRTEMYVHTISGIDPKPFLMQVLLDIKHMPALPDGEGYFYALSGREAVEHFLRVASGLDSIVLGEKQILGQVKRAVDLARVKGMMGKSLNVLAAVAIRAGKKAQHETQIGFGGVSVSWAAVAMAREVLDTLEGKSVLIIGAGKMGHLAAGQLKNQGIGHIYVMNRSEEKAAVLAQAFEGTAVSYWDMGDILKNVDVCICSAGAPHYILEEQLVRKTMALRPQRRLLCIDISMPRNIAPPVALVPNVSLITIDDLDSVVEENLQKRRAAITDVERIVARKLEEYYRKIVKVYAVEEAQGVLSCTYEPISQRGRAL